MLGGTLLLLAFIRRSAVGAGLGEGVQGRDSYLGVLRVRFQTKEDRRIMRFFLKVKTD